jgi:hypothetical protein
MMVNIAMMSANQKSRPERRSSSVINPEYLIYDWRQQAGSMTRKRKVDLALERHFWIGLAAVIVLGVLVVMLDAYLRGML